MSNMMDRENNFFNSIELSTSEDRAYYSLLQWLAEDIEHVSEKMQGVDSPKDILTYAFSRVYDFVIADNIRSNNDYRIFEDRDENQNLYNVVFDACLFISICQFLYETKRIEAKSLRKFIYDNSPMQYNVKGSPNYFDYSRPKDFLESNSDNPEGSSNLIEHDEANLRQYRKRLRDQRPIKHYSREWSAIRRVSEHEWALYLKEDSEIQETNKRIRNLYTDIHRAFNSKMDAEYIKRLDDASEKCCRKLKKLSYEQYLKYGKFCLDDINKDKTCYGINLYRFEKFLQLYRITSDVNRLLKCTDEAEANRIIDLAIQTDNIPFPKLYEYFSSLSDIRNTKHYADIFWSLMDKVVRSSRLIFDKFVEDGVFGETWDQLFLDTTNELADVVLYNPSEIDYSITPESNREFQIYFLEPVDRAIISKKSQFSQLSSWFSLVHELNKNDEI